MLCKVQDSNGVVCNKSMTQHEFEQDGMCDACACNLFNEMFGDLESWSHDDDLSRTKMVKL